MSQPEPIRYLSAAELQTLHARLMEFAGSYGTLLDEAKLESTAMRPANIAYYENADLLDQAASLITGIALAHAFSDGNKRLSAYAGAVFLRRNGVIITAKPPAFGEQILAVVNRTDHLEVATERLIEWLRAHTAPSGAGQASP